MAIRYSIDKCVGGTATASSEYSTNYDHLAFDDNGATLWSSAERNTCWIAYEFAGGAAYKITKVTTIAVYGANQIMRAFKIQGWTGAAYTDLYSGEMANSAAKQEFTFTNTTAYTKIRLISTTDWGAGPTFYEIEMMVTLKDGGAFLLNMV